MMNGIIGHDNFIVVMVGTKKGAYIKSSIRFNLFSTTTKYGQNKATYRIPTILLEARMKTTNTFQNHNKKDT